MEVKNLKKHNYSFMVSFAEDIAILEFKRIQDKRRRRELLQKRSVISFIDYNGLNRGLLEKLRCVFTLNASTLVKLRLLTFPAAEIREAFVSGPINYTMELGFYGDGFDSLTINSKDKLKSWHKKYQGILKNLQAKIIEKELSDYESLSVGIFSGWVIAGIAGLVFDKFFKISGIIEAIVRFLAGAGDTIGGFFVTLYLKFKKKEAKEESEGHGGEEEKSSMMSFVYGTLLGTLVGPLMHFLIIQLGFDSQGIWGAVYASAYSNADNWGGAISALIHYAKKHGFRAGIKKFIRHPFQLANLLVISFILFGNMTLRSLGIWQPDSYFDFAIEGAIMNNDSTVASLSVWIYSLRLRKQYCREAACFEKQS